MLILNKPYRQFHVYIVYIPNFGGFHPSQEIVSLITTPTKRDLENFKKKEEDAYMESIIIIAVMVLLFYFMIIKPGRARAKKQSSQDKQETLTTVISEPTPKADGPYDHLYRYAAYKKQPQYKIDWLTESINQGHELESDGYYVMESMDRDVPYFYETEWEHDMLYNRRSPPLRGSVNGMMDAAWFYNELFHPQQAHTSKYIYWKQQLIDAANNGNREAQAALCSAFAERVFASEPGDVEKFRLWFEEALWKDAETGDKYAQLSVGAWLCKDTNDAISWLQKAANQRLTDAYWWLANKLGLTFSRFVNIETDHGTETQMVSVPEDERLTIRLQILDCYKSGAECANGIMTSYCQAQIGSAYEDGDEIPQDLEKAKFWYRKAAEGGDDYAIRHLESWELLHS